MNEYDEYGDYTPYDQRYETYIMPAVFSLILIVGGIGNVVLISILLRNVDMRSAPNIYVLSLAFGDLLLLVTCIPFTSAIYTIGSWPWSLTICKLSEFVKDVSIGVTVFTLAALAAERHGAIVNSIRRHAVGSSAKPAVILTGLIWILATFLALPAALFSHVAEINVTSSHGNVSVQFCDPFPDEFGRVYEKSMVMFKFMAYYAAPLCAICFFNVGTAQHLTLSVRNIPAVTAGCNYHRGQMKARNRASKTVLSVVILFLICFLPYHVYMLWFHFCPTSLEDYDYFWHVFKMVGFCLSFSNSCINPIALYLISSTFRQNFNQYLCCYAPCGRDAYSGDRTERGVRNCGGDRFSQINRGDMQDTFYISLDSNCRRQIQDLRSTEVFELGAV